MEVYEEGREDEEEYVGEGVDKLCNVGGEGIVLLTPVHRTRASVSVLPVKQRHWVSMSIQPLKLIGILTAH